MRVSELDTRRILFQQSQINFIYFDLIDESGQETILCNLCIVLKVGVLTSKVASPPCHNNLSLASLRMCYAAKNL